MAVALAVEVSQPSQPHVLNSDVFSLYAERMSVLLIKTAVGISNDVSSILCLFKHTVLSKSQSPGACKEDDSKIELIRN